MTDSSSVPVCAAVADAPFKKYVVGHVDDVPEGGRVIVDIQGRQIGVYRVDGKFYAMLNRCPHLGGPLCEGQVVMGISAAVPGEVKGHADQTYVTCPWHNWEFDIKTGQSYWNPKGLRSRPMPVSVETGEAVDKSIVAGTAQRIKGPYSAETLPVDVKGDYVVLTVKTQAPHEASANDGAGQDGAVHDAVIRVMPADAEHAGMGRCAVKILESV